MLYKVVLETQTAGDDLVCFINLSDEDAQLMSLNTGHQPLAYVESHDRCEGYYRAPCIFCTIRPIIKSVAPTSEFAGELNAQFARDFLRVIRNDEDRLAEGYDPYFIHPADMFEDDESDEPDSTA